MNPVWWVLLGYVGCWLHIIAASWIGEALKRRRLEQTHVVRNWGDVDANRGVN